MTREELDALVQELMGYSSPDHQARTSEILTNISEGFQSVLNNSEQANKKVDELTIKNETLRKVNTDLFLKTGTKTEPKKDPEPPTQSEPNEPVSFDTLFNDKGELI